MFTQLLIRSRMWQCISCMPYQMDDCGTRPFLRWVLVQGHGSDMSSGSKNASSLIGISLLKTINLAPLEKFRAWGNDPLRHKMCQSQHTWHRWHFSGTQVRQSWPMLQDYVTKSHEPIHAASKMAGVWPKLRGLKLKSPVCSTTNP